MQQSREQIGSEIVPRAVALQHLQFEPFLAASEPRYPVLQQAACLPALMSLDEMKI